MIVRVDSGQAASNGWVDAAGRSIQAHIERISTI